MSFLNEVSDDLYTAVGNLGFERGRVNVVLNDVGPVQKMEANRQFILERRTEGSKALKIAINKLSLVQLKHSKDAIESILRLTPEIDKLRDETAEDLLISKDQRKHGLAEKWFEAMTVYIETIESLLVGISSEISDADGMISRYSSLKRETLALRNTAGPEMSILSATMLSGEPLSQQSIKKISDLHVKISEHFLNLENLSHPLEEIRIPQSLKELKQSYFEMYGKSRDIILPLALKGGPYPFSQNAFLDQGVKALSQIAILMNAIVIETKIYSDRKLIESRDQIVFQVCNSAGSLILIMLILIFLHLRVIRPISLVTTAILRLAKKEPDVNIPHQDAKNEIGEMARAVAVFKGMANQLDKDVIALEKASKERESLIIELQENLAEIQTLRGILPICSFCKNIRNDEGYYEQIESYIQKRSGVDFSHTICPKCLKVHYPEQYEDIAKTEKW